MLTVAIYFFVGVLSGIWLKNFFDVEDEKATKKYCPFGRISNSKGGVNLGPPGPRPKQAPVPQFRTH